MGKYVKKHSQEIERVCNSRDMILKNNEQDDLILF